MYIELTEKTWAWFFEVGTIAEIGLGFGEAVEKEGLVEVDDFGAMSGVHDWMDV